jgi:hypothetical protein
MTPGRKRAACRAAAAMAAATVTWGVTGLPGRALLRGPLALIAVAVTGNLAVQARTSAKAYATEQRLNAHIAATGAAVALVANGGTIGGPVTVTGAVSASGTTGAGGQGSIMGDQFTSTIPGGGTFNAAGTTWLNAFQAAYNAHVTDTQATVNRVNDLLAALG